MHKRHSVCKISHDYIQATVCWWHVPGRQQKIELIRDRIRWAVWTVVISGNDCNRFEIDPIWTQSGFKLNRTNLNRSQSIYMWTRSKSSYIIEVSLLSLESERSCICVLGVSSQESERSCICVKWKTKITSLTEEFLNPIEKSQIETKSILLTHKYMTAHFPGLMLLTHKYMTAHFPGLILLTYKYMTAHFPGLILLTHKYMTAHDFNVHTKERSIAIDLIWDP
jgi:hypothetical protein